MRSHDTTRPTLALLFGACLMIAVFGGMRTDAATPSSLLKTAKVEDKDKALFFGGCDSDPYPYLEKRHRGDKSNSFITRGADSKTGIDAALACRLMKLLEFAETKGCSLTINSAMRPRQRCNPDGGACARQGNSCHQYGLAVDIGGTSRCLEWVTTVIGRKNPNSPFKVHVAYQENSNDYRHIQCSEHIIANASHAQGCRTSCDGSARITPDTTSIAGPGRTSPSGGLADSFRKMIGGDQPTAPSQPTPQAQPAPAAQPSLPQQPGSVQSNQLFGDRGTGLGTAGTAPTGTAVPVIAMPPLGTKASTTPESAEQASYYSSVTDQLLQLAYDTPLATSTTVATSVPLTIDGNDVKTIDMESGNIDSATTSGAMAYGAPGTVLPSSNTFVSNDLGGGPYQVVASYRGEPTGFIALLVQLRDAFAALLTILRPMGIREAIAPATHEHGDELVEPTFDSEADFKAGVEEDITIEFVRD